MDWSRAPKALLDRVEVLEGGGSHLYGNGAMGGVISLFTKAVAPGDYRIVADGGMRDSKHLFGAVGTALSPSLSLSLVGDYGDGGGYRLLASPGAGPADFPSTSARGNGIARFEYAPSADVSAFVTAQFFHDERRVEGQLGRTTRTDGATTLGLSIGAGNPGLLSARAWLRNMREDQRLTTIIPGNGSNRGAEQSITFYHIPSYDRGVSVSWSRNDLWKFANVGLGVDYRSLAGMLDERNYANSAVATPTSRFTSAGNQTFRGAYITAMFSPRERWSMEVTARTDRWGNSDGVTTDDTGISTYPTSGRNAFSPRGGVRYTFDSTLALHVAGYQAFHAPNLSQLFRKSIQGAVALLPNPELLPEFVMAWEAGADWQPRTWVQLKGTLYRANYRDLSVSSNGNSRQRTSSLFARSLGAQVSLAVRPVEGLDLSGSMNFDDARVTNPGESGFGKNARLPRVPLQRVLVSAAWRSGAVGMVTLAGRYEGKSTTTGGRMLNDYRVYDASYERAIGAGLRLLLAVENLYDVKYQVNLTGNGSSTLTTLGTPRTVRLGIEASRY